MSTVYMSRQAVLNLCWAIVGTLALASCGTQQTNSRAASSSTTNVAAPILSSAPAIVQLQPTSVMANTSDTKAVEIPDPARCYVDAVNANNLNALVACFAPDAFIIDVNRRITGVDAIRNWADDEVIGGNLQVLESTPTPNGTRLLVHFIPKGFTGFRAYYTFNYQNGKITQADLQYAN